MPELQQLLELVLELGHDGRLGTEVQRRAQDREEVGERGKSTKVLTRTVLARSVGVVATPATNACRRRGRRAAAGGGEKSDGEVDCGDPGPIPLA